MDNILYIPDLNPIRFYEVEPNQPAKYQSKHFDIFPFYEQQKPWDHLVRYSQKWQTNDIIYLQFISNFSPIQVELIDKYGISRHPLSANPVRADKYRPGFYLYQVALNCAVVTPGCYFMKLSAGDPLIATMFSEPLNFAVRHDNTLFLEYRNSRYHGDVVFETGIRFGIRLEGSIGRVIPGRNTSSFIDQKENPFVLTSQGFRAFPLNMGGARGLPDWAVDKFNLIWTCNSVWVDGKEFAAMPDSKPEYNEIPRWAMRGIKMDVREGVNRGSKIIGGSVNQELRLFVVSNIEGKLFGDFVNPGSGNIISITDIE